jgi:hypothetical protein
MNQIVKAEAPGFIWLIVGVFWVIAQIAGAAAKKNQSLRPPVASNDDPGEAPGDPFAELLRKMAGAEQFRVEPPAFKEEPEEKPWKPGEIEKLPDIEPLRREPMGQAEIRPAPAEVPKIDIRPKMSAFRNSVPSIKLPAMSLSFQPLEKSGGKFPTIGRIINPSDKNSLRRAMLSHIIFSPPKALSRTSE